MSRSPVLSFLRLSSRNWTRKLHQRLVANINSGTVCERTVQGPSFRHTPASHHTHSITVCTAGVGHHRKYCSASLSENRYEDLADETLERLSDKFDDIAETVECDTEYDVSYGWCFDCKNQQRMGTYVINKQTPNKQIWLSSPVSGPKRYDYINGRWIYKHDGVAMLDLLTQELSEALSTPLDFTQCELDDT